MGMAIAATDEAPVVAASPAIAVTILALATFTLWLDALMRSIAPCSIRRCATRMEIQASGGVFASICMHLFHLESIVILNGALAPSHCLVILCSLEAV